MRTRLAIIRARWFEKGIGTDDVAGDGCGAKYGANEHDCYNDNDTERGMHIVNCTEHETCNAADNSNGSSGDDCDAGRADCYNCNGNGNYNTNDDGHKTYAYNTNAMAPQCWLLLRCG